MRKSQAKWWLIPMLLLALVASSSRPTLGQRGADGGGTTAKKKRKVRGRLPAYYAKVVTSDQRKEIYSIQAKYNLEISKLRQQLMKLVKDRDRDVEEVLSTDQLQKVKAMRAAAKAKRRKRRAARGAGTTRRR